MDRSVTLSSPALLTDIYTIWRGQKQGKRGEVKEREGRKGEDWGGGSEAKGEGGTEGGMEEEQRK